MRILSKMKSIRNLYFHFKKTALKSISSLFYFRSSIRQSENNIVLEAVRKILISNDNPKEYVLENDISYYYSNLFLRHSKNRFSF